MAGGIVRVRISGDIVALWNVEARWAVVVPLMSSKAACGFPSPADDHLDKPLDFNELLIRNPASTVCVDIGGESMAPLLLPGDRVVIDRSLTAGDRSIILACLNGEFTVKRYRRKGRRCWLQPENPAYPVIPLNEDSTFQIEGVMVWSLRRLLP